MVISRWPLQSVQGNDAGRRDSCSKHKVRTTLVIAFWKKGISASADDSLGPCMAFNGTSQHSRAWFSSIPAVDIEDGVPRRRGKSQKVQAVKAWDETEGPGSQKRYVNAPLPDLRFLTRVTPCIRNFY